VRNLLPHIVFVFLVFCAWPAAGHQLGNKKHYHLLKADKCRTHTIKDPWHYKVKSKATTFSKRKTRAKATKVLPAELPSDFVTRFIYTPQVVRFSANFQVIRIKHGYDMRGPPAAS